jgi:hypothetical protein
MRFSLCAWMALAAAGCGGNSNNVSDHGLCDAYLTCAGVAAPDQVAGLQQYSTNGACWSNESNAAGCRAACEAGIVDMHALAPAAAECFPAGFMPDPTRAMPGTVGANCTIDADCGTGGTCLTEADGYPGGYCTVLGCSKGTCPTGTCFSLQDGSTMCLQDCRKDADCGTDYLCPDYDACTPGCKGTGCGPDEECGADGLCTIKPCTATSCGPFTVCASNGFCEPDVTTLPAGTPPTCTNLPERDCKGSNCNEIIQFDPDMGPGYHDYPINGEAEDDQYRSFLRREHVMLTKWAAAVTECKTAGWTTGNNMPLGLGDMSEANGAIPGTRENDPGHPEGTHVNGFDMDFAYFQIKGTNNFLREICPHTAGGKEQYHCTGEPDNVDLWKHALYLGTLFTAPNIRVIGVDGRVGPLLEKALAILCQKGWLEQSACDNAALAYEQVDMGYGWYLFHLHHSHVSTVDVPNAFPAEGGRRMSFATPRDRERFGIRALAKQHKAYKVTE